jgi:purine-cytosine permease-like protein
MSETDAETRRRSTRTVARWIVLLLAAIVTVTVVVVADWLVLFGHSSTCHDAPDPDAMMAGRAWLGGVLLVSALPWTLGAAMSRHRVAVLVVGALAVTPGLLVFLVGLGRDAWVGNFCF